MQSILTQAAHDLSQLLPTVEALALGLQELADALMACWERGGKVLIAGNGGSAADAMHFAEELLIRFRITRRGLAAIAMCDPATITAAANDFGYESIFARQLEGLGNRGDVFIAMTTSGNSPNILKAIDVARESLVTVAFLGKDGGQAHGRCHIELLVPSSITARVQESHKLLFHSLCEWIDQRLKPGHVE